MGEAAAVFGVLAGILSVLDAVPYARDVIRRTTRPQRATWFIWSMLALVAVASQLADGAAWSIVMVATQAMVTTLVFLLSIRHGEGGLSTLDLTAVAIAALGVLGWFAFS